MDETPVQRNVWNDNEYKQQQPPTEYIDLGDVINLGGLTYDDRYREQEKALLEPQLIALGYTNIEWLPGETDSFGPLTRVCKAKNRFGDVFWFIYG